MEEIWKDIEGYEGLYQVSNLGRVKSLERVLKHGHLWKGKMLKLLEHGGGYKKVNLSKDGKNKQFYVHRLVAQTFIPNSDNLTEVNHKDENPSNNRVDNLEWCTASYNINYGTRNMRHAEKMSKRVYQYSLDGELINVWQSTREIERQLGYSHGNIGMGCRRNKQYYGFIWEYAS